MSEIITDLGTYIHTHVRLLLCWFISILWHFKRIISEVYSTLEAHNGTLICTSGNNSCVRLARGATKPPTNNKIVIWQTKWPSYYCSCHALLTTVNVIVTNNFVALIAITAINSNQESSVEMLLVAFECSIGMRTRGQLRACAEAKINVWSSV